MEIDKSRKGGWIERGQVVGPGPVVERLSQTIHQDPAWRKEGVPH